MEDFIQQLKTLEPMTWLIIGAAIVISVAVLFNKAIKLLLKIAVIAVVAAVVVYFLVQAGVIAPPPLGD